jgi:hypothetical protein
VSNTLGVARVEHAGAGRRGEHHGQPVRLGLERADGAHAQMRRVVALGGERFEQGDVDAQLRVDGGGDGAGQLDADALDLRALLPRKDVEAESRHDRERQDARGDQHQESPSQRDALLGRVA